MDKQAKLCKQQSLQFDMLNIQIDQLTMDNAGLKYELGSA